MLYLLAHKHVKLGKITSSNILVLHEQLDNESRK
jgi:hypothetical protein